MAFAQSEISYQTNVLLEEVAAKPPNLAAYELDPKTAISQAEQIELWLRQYGFTYNPFQYTNSERDTNLSEHFVEYPDFEQALGLDHQLFFARTGDGKTATRLRLQSFYRDAVRDHHVFAFSYLIPEELATASFPALDGHIQAILTAAVRHAFVFFALRGSDLPALQDDAIAGPLAQQFSTYFDHYYGLENSWKSDLRQAIADYSLQQVVSSLSSVYDDLEAMDAIGITNPLWLKRWLHLLETAADQSPRKIPSDPLLCWSQFSQLLQATGIQSIMILVDSVDVKPGTRRDVLDDFPLGIDSQLGKSDIAAHMVSLIRPLFELIHEQTLGTQLVWKLFFPIELYLPLIPYLPSELSHVILHWDYERLSQLLKFRLSAATNGAVTSLLQLAETDVPADLEKFLIIQSVSSPRYLIHYINNIFGIHVSQSSRHRLPGKFTGSSLAKIRYKQHQPT